MSYYQQQPQGQYSSQSGGGEYGQPASQQQQYGSNSPPDYSGYGGYSQQQQAGIPMQYGGTAPATGAVQCNMLRSELEAKLQASNYGANTKIYECYFRRRDPNSAVQQAPLCLACGMPIQSHGGGGVAVRLDSAPMENLSDPSNLKRGATQDVAESGYLMGLIIGAAICIATSCILFIAFGASGMIAKTSVVLIGPCICLTIGVAMLFMTKSSTITFDRGNKRIHLEQKRICCKTTDVTIPFSDLTGKATMESTSVRVNGVPQVEIVAGLVPGSVFSGQLTVQRGGMFSLMSAATEWSAYLTRLKHGDVY